MNIWPKNIKHNKYTKLMKKFILFQTVLLCSFSSAQLVNSSVSVSNFTKLPALLSSSATPLVMLALSNDHQLYFKLYTDWDDLDKDGIQDTTYKHSIDYYGYFDSYKCYDYDTTDERFKPKTITADKSCTGASNGYFSGNFLNWSSMTRIDAIRKVLYGGFRSADTASLTVLERSFLPTDAHSFAKHYEPGVGDVSIRDITPFNVTEMTLCNTTYNSSSGSAGQSQNAGDPPLIRMVEGDFRYWAANERWQCTWDNERGDNRNGNNVTSSQTSDPNETTDGLGQNNYKARVEVCDSTLIGTENCNTYDDSGTTRYKPIGLLQTYGESGAVDFGLITGSYQKNKSGGVVRKNIGTFANEINTSTGQIIKTAGVDGIIDTIDKFRISRYGYSDSGRYNTPDSCPWGRSSITEGNCSNWGNPFSEIYLEAVRYFAGLSKNASFDADDTGYISNLTDVSSWNDPLNTSNRCASCNIVVINASDISYDDDALSMVGLPNSPSATSLTDAVGDSEGITGGRYFVGESGASVDQLCTAKSITNFGSVKGSCPNAPRLSGTYNIAGISHWAHTEDIRTDLADNQTVNTYAVALAPSTPSINIPDPNNLTSTLVTLLPACRNISLTPNGNCAIVDFKILSQNAAAGTGVLYVNWEDSEQGGDFDQDMAGTIAYAVVGSTITIVTDVIGLSTGYKMGFGYVISGTTNDGFHVHSGVRGFTYTDVSGVADCSAGCSDNEPPFASSGQPATSQSYTIGTSSASLLNDPLWYAAKYGGFNDLDNDKNPNEISDSEWDLRDTSGNTGSDGIPDNYFPVFNPSELEDRMNQVFAAILNRVSAGNAAAVVSKTSSGIGAIYQAIYQPLIKDGLAEVEWTGFMHAIFIDSKGLLREDSNANGLLDGYGTDLVIEIFFNPSLDETQVQRFTSVNGTSLAASGQAVALHELKPIWSAIETMSLISNAVIKSNRTYDPTQTTNGRYMYTWIDDTSGTGTVGTVDTGEVVPFVESQFTAAAGNNYHYLNVANPADGIDDGDDAGDIINFVRGVTGIPNQRNRIIDYDKDGTIEKLRIGDIIHSTPVAVGQPNDGYNTIYSDKTYRDFRNQYANRRQVVYVGSNDGVIHAFNSGFWDDSVTGFVTDLNNTFTGEFGLPLGAELWGYVPMNILPHLKWLPEIDYPHVYFMDAEPIVFDAKIFSSDADHPHGWGTILVIGMRLGGGDISLDIDGDNSLNGANDITTRSSYIVMDITNPEVAPTLIAEINDVNLQFTVSRPELITVRKPVLGDYNTGVNEWYLTFGSGPDDITNVFSSQTSRAYIWDLKTQTFVTGFDGTANGPAQGYMGDFTTIDWDLDGVTDNIYFGTDDSTIGTASGTMQRIEIDPSNLTNSSRSTMLSASQAIINKPLAVREGRNKWVFSGSGRLFTSSDVGTTHQESFYGIQEDSASPSKTFTLSDLQNVTGVEVYDGGFIEDVGGVLSGEPLVTDATGFSWLENLIDGKDGWYYNFTTGTNPSERNLGNAVSINKLLAYTIYTPSVDQCDNIGGTNLRVNCLTTGTACPFDILGLQTSTNGDRAIAEVSFTSGLITDISVHFDGQGNASIIGHGQHGNIQQQAINLPPLFFGRKSWREIIDY